MVGIARVILPDISYVDLRNGFSMPHAFDFVIVRTTAIDDLGSDVRH
jgi:hypothetical protein